MKFLFAGKAHYSVVVLKGIFTLLSSLQVMPGLLLCFVMRYDNYKKQAAVAADTEQSKITYFHCSLIGYIVGKIASMELNNYVSIRTLE